MSRLAVLLALGLAVAADCQPVTIHGQVRTRSELDDRDLTGQVPASAFHLLRTRLGVEARPSHRVRALVQVQDARLWGGEDPALALGTLDGDADQLDVHQAYVELDSLGGRGVSLRLGRQELAYGNERLIGAVGWSNVGRSFDAARLRAAVGSVTADLFAAQLVTAAGASDGQGLVGVFASVPVGAWTMEATALVDGDADVIETGPDAGARRRQRTTAGLRATGRIGPLGVDAEVYGQGGAMVSGPDRPRDDLRAWLGSAEVSAEVGRLGLALGATQLSGDGDPTDGVDRRFDTLFATNHKFYGAMDYVPALVGTAGLQDLYASATGDLGRGWHARAAGHVFAAAADVEDGRAVGAELDLGLRYTIAPSATLDVGASAFRAASRVADEGSTTWAYAMLTVGF